MLELREADAAGAVIVTEAEDAAGGDEAADHRDALRLVDADGLVLATAACHDLVAEASGGADPGTAVTPVAPVDVTGFDQPDEPGAADTFSLAVLPDAPDGDLAGLALSTELPPLAFESSVVVGHREGTSGAIRSGDDVDSFAAEGTITVSGLLDRSGLRRIRPGRRRRARALPRRRVRRADVPLGDSRAVVMAYLSALAAPIAANAGPTGHPRRRDARAWAGVARASAPGYATRAAFVANAVRGAGTWAERFVNDLGLAPEDPNPNAKIKLKL